MKIGAFTLETMTDGDLENLYLSAQAERIRRAYRHCGCICQGVRRIYS